MEQQVEETLIKEMIQSAMCAPSGKNGQPWRFKIVTDKTLINVICDLTAYGRWMKTAPCFIMVYLDQKSSYDYIKDMQSCGAVIQNILLCANSLGLGSCWIGEILDKSNEVGLLLDIDKEKYELAALLTIGYKAGRTMNLVRNNIEKFML
ncbi:MAG: nitroreductase family protein [Clostridiales bacterium]|nr:nitroreductase family protein [Clostridiales bacterium]